MNFAETLNMKSCIFLCATVFFYFCAMGRETTYVGSTPAHRHVRYFLGLSLTDSIDFIRWKLTVREAAFTLHCEYGISKPNTNGFINDKTVDLSGKLKSENNRYYLPNGDKGLTLVEVNPNLLHIAGADNRLLVGNGGWSYTLNNANAQATDQFTLVSKPPVVKDSMEFEGRTPCQPLAEMLQLGKSPDCYKKKWFIVFYVDPASGRPAGYLTEGIPRFRETMKEGKWKIVQGKNGRVIYQLQYPGKNTSVYLLVADENTLYFTDAEGKLLVGNEDFSYTLNRRK